MAKHFNPAAIWQPFGAFSMVAAQGDGQIVHLKGQVALDRDGRLIGKGDMRVQVRKVLENIAAVLASLGGNMGDVASRACAQKAASMSPPKTSGFSGSYRVSRRSSRFAGPGGLAGRHADQEISALARHPNGRNIRFPVAASKRRAPSHDRPIKAKGPPGRQAPPS